MKITEKYIFFWKEYLSQWHKSIFIVDGITFNCAEQYMMYKKAFLFDDKESCKKILLAHEPYRQKEIGRDVLNFKAKQWDEVKEAIVYAGNHAKFTQNPLLQVKLLGTGDKTLVEASPYDTIWGIAMDENHPNIENPFLWKGQNLLGKVLTKLRDNLKQTV